MENECKCILGLQKRFFFTIEDRHKIIQEMLSTDCTKREIWEKYTGEPREHGQIVRWMHQLGYTMDKSFNNSNLGEKNNMTSKKVLISKASDESFENLQLKKRIMMLEVQLKEAEMKAIAFSTMVDIAEKEFNIPIRKKVNTKPLK